MYRTVRNLHLIFGLLSLPYLLMYGISSVQMAHTKWFVNRPAVEQTSAALPAGISDSRVVVRELLLRGAVGGEITRASQKGDKLEMRVTRPGTVAFVTYSLPDGTTQIRTERANWIFLLNRLHHVAGVDHEYSATNVWGAALGIVAFLMLALGATGVYLWFQLHKERRIGTAILLVNVLFSVAMLIILRSA
jgi:hypothetical protein